MAHGAGSPPAHRRSACSTSPRTSPMAALARQGGCFCRRAGGIASFVRLPAKGRTVIIFLRGRRADPGGGGSCLPALGGTLDVALQYHFAIPFELTVYPDGGGCAGTARCCAFYVAGSRWAQVSPPGLKRTDSPSANLLLLLAWGYFLQSGRIRWAALTP